MSDNKVRIGLIGAGRIGRLHAGHLAHRIPSATLYGVADVAADAVRQVGKVYDVPVVADDYRDLLACEAIDAVLICSATNTHAQIIADAAGAGKHIFCEKPIALDLAQIDRALAAVAAAGVKLQVGFNRRFDGEYRRVRRAVESGEIGAPHLMHIISRDPGPPPLEYVKVSGGLFLDMMIHDFDMARYLLGVEAVEVYASGNVLVDDAIGSAGDIDTALVTLKFANGALGVIDNSRQAVYGYDQRVEVLGSAGAIRTDNRYSSTATVMSASEVRRDLPYHFFLERYAQSYIDEVTEFVGAIVQDAPTPVSGQDGRIPVVMALAAGKSLAENRPVRLAEIDPAL